MKKLFLALFVLLALPLSAAEPASTEPFDSAQGKPSRSVDKIIAIVGDSIITASDLARAESFSPKKSTQGEILEDLIKEKLMENEIKRLEIEVTPQELSQTIGGVLQQNKMSLEQLKEELKKKNMSYEQYKAQVSENIKRMKFIGREIYSRLAISDTEVEAYRKTNDKLSPEEAKRQLYDLRGQQELEKYLNEIRQKTYVDILN